MKLRELLREVSVLDTPGASVDDPHLREVLDREVVSVTRDSRTAGPDAVFVAIRGSAVDGHRFAGSVRAAAVVVEDDVPVAPGVVRVRVGDSKLALAEISAALHGHPGRRVQVVGVTGTNGKSTLCALVEGALVRGGRSVARVGTLGNVVEGMPHPVRFTTPTTPESPELQAFLAELAGRGVGTLVMEATSIGLAQRRVDGIPFALGVFTNLSQDHLDFHGDMATYALAKSRLFTELLREPGGAPRALLCGDDPAWESMQPPADRWLYGFGPGCDVRVTRLELGPAGIRLDLDTPVGKGHLRSPMIGKHNAVNLAGAVAVCLLLGVGLEEALAWVGSVSGVPGRLEVVGQRPLVVVDFAHTPGALEQALAATREVTEGRLWVVFGCGGDRDRTKRPIMGRIAAEGADEVVVTSDNPRHEAPEAIVAEILAGIHGRAPRAEVDRHRAIHLAISEAGPRDAVLLAGKGHETTQQLGDELRPFDDREIARAALEGR